MLRQERIGELERTLREYSIAQDKETRMLVTRQSKDIKAVEEKQDQLKGSVLAAALEHHSALMKAAEDGFASRSVCTLHPTGALGQKSHSIWIVGDRNCDNGSGFSLWYLGGKWCTGTVQVVRKCCDEHRMRTLKYVAFMSFRGYFYA